MIIGSVFVMEMIGKWGRFALDGGRFIHGDTGMRVRSINFSNQALGIIFVKP